MRMPARVIDGSNVAKRLLDQTRDGLITPVRGGVGPMTIAMLLAQTVTAAERTAQR
jgi:5,10-methylene-tetrahydrofolate dehydrogenase/methenyl tetrahydrofolate cyclohydrolase